MDIGTPYEIPTELCELYLNNKKEATAVLLTEIENVMFYLNLIINFYELNSLKQRLKSCLITATNYATLSAIFTIRSIYKPDNIRLTAEQEFILNRRFALAINQFESAPELQPFIDSVKAYNSKLKALGIKDEEVINLNKRYLHDILSIMKSFSLFWFNAAFVKKFSSFFF